MSLFDRSSLVLSFVASVFLGACAAPEVDAETASSEQAVVSAREPAFDVEVSTRRVLTDTPTYGYYPTAPYLSITVLVEDAKLRAGRPGFDGYERPFVLIPRKDAGSPAVRWERHALAYRGVTLRGYYADRRLDMYELASLRLSESDLEAARSLGVAVGADTNVGTVWAQDGGSNFTVPQPQP